MKKIKFLLIFLLSISVISCAENEVLDAAFLGIEEISEVNEVDGIDNDGLTDDEEITGIDDPITPADPNGNITDPEMNDTDGDGMPDGQEAIDGTDPNDENDTSELDRDGLTNEEEITGIDNPLTPPNPNGNITDPEISDTDGDGMSDGEEAIDGTDPNDENDNIIQDTGNPIVATTDCTFEDLGIESGDTIGIDCLVDLEGRTVSVPNGVTLEFDGGDIFNGTLDFSSGGEIEGMLLNSDLGIEGDVSLIDEEFEFIPSRWDIVEASGTNNPQPPSLEEAYNNHLNIQSSIDLVKSLGASTFSIGEMNAFFDCLNGETDFRAAANAVIILPSNFHLRMSDNTYIRVLPVSGILSSDLIRVFTENDITISGGNLIGDRLEHGPEQANDGIVGGVLAIIKGGKRILVENVNMSLSYGTGLTINSNSFISRADYVGSEDVTIRNCVFDSSRANNLSLTDGQNIVIENNRSVGAGRIMEGSFGLSEGIAPRIGILVETQVLQFVEGVVIRNNIVEDSHSFEEHSILAVGATDVIITENTTDLSVGWSTALGVQVTNNTAGRIFGGFLGFEGVNNIVSGNTITNEDGAGIFLTDQNVTVYDNDLINCRTGIQLSSLINAEIYDNRITSNIANSVGIVGQNYLDEVNIYENDFNLPDGRPFNIIAINTQIEEENYQLNFINNTITASESGLLPGSSNITIEDNNFNGAGLSLSNTNNIIVKDNIIRNSGDFAAFAVDGSENITITGNTFEATNDGPFSTAVRISSLLLDSSTIFHNNIVSSLGNNFGMNVTGADDISIQNNTIQNESTFRQSLFFEGNNSEIINNTLINSNGFEGLLYEGNNNTVTGNN